MATPTERYAVAAARLSTRTATALLRIWDTLPSLEVEDSLAWHAQAEPLVRASATASMDLTRAYASTLAPDLTDPSDLIVDEAVAHLFEPFDRYARLADDPVAATAAARSVASSVGHDTVYRTARQSIGDMLTGTGRWVRLVTGKSCNWCMSLSTAEFPSAAAASFGHANCDCIPVPTDAGTALNVRTRSDAGWDDQASIRYRERHHRASLRRQERTARRRSAEARREQITEADPARRERLSIREQEWETRAERAAERLRILDTGTHRLT